jgi:hypothetical protein
MQATPFNPMRKREELKTQRNLLFKRFLRNPLDTSLALKIKIIDDQVAASDEQMEREKEVELNSTRFPTGTTGRTLKNLNRGDKHGKTTLTPRLLAWLDLHCPRIGLSDAHCS